MYLCLIKKQISGVFLIPSGRKHPLLMCNSHKYKYHSPRGGKVYWRCTKIKQGCKATIRTNSDNIEDGFVILHQEHNHATPCFHRTFGGFWIKT